MILSHFSKHWYLFSFANIANIMKRITSVNSTMWMESDIHLIYSTRLGNISCQCQCNAILHRQEEWKAMRDQWIRNGQGFMVMYAINDRGTFEDLPPLFDRIKMVKETERGPMVLVGNKCDLEQEREVSREEAEKLANRLGIPFFEASAKTKVNVTEAFTRLARDMRRYAKKPEPEKSGKK